VKRHLATIYDKLAMPGRLLLALHVVKSRDTAAHAASPL
jgi:hypothetical protein